MIFVVGFICWLVVTENRTPCKFLAVVLFFP